MNSLANDEDNDDKQVVLKVRSCVLSAWQELDAELGRRNGSPTIAELARQRADQCVAFQDVIEKKFWELVADFAELREQYPEAFLDLVDEKRRP